MNVAGAALATCISNVVSVLYLLGHIIRTRKESTVQLAVFPQRLRLSYVAEVFSGGAPAALQIVLASVSNSVMIRLMSGYVESAISGLGIAQKIEMIPFQIVQGLSSGVLPLIAYNYASGNRKRMDVRYGSLWQPEPPFRWFYLSWWNYPRRGWSGFLLKMRLR